MKKIITVSTLFATSAIFAFATTPACPDSPITAIVAASQKGGADSATKIMQIQAKENIDISRDSFLIYQLASCQGAEATLMSAAKDGNTYAIKALKMTRIADAEDCLLELAKTASSQTKKDAIDALSACGTEKSLKFFVEDIDKADAALLGDYVKVSTELYKSLNDAQKPALTAIIQDKMAAADGKVKVALERILGDQSPKEAAAPAPAAEGESGELSKAAARKASRKRG